MAQGQDDTAFVPRFRDFAFDRQGDDNDGDSRPALPGLHARVCSRSRSSGRLRAPRGGHELSTKLLRF